MRRHLFLLWAVATAAALLLQPAAAEADCRTQMAEAFRVKDPDLLEWVDPDTPSDRCTKDLGGDRGELQLVFSDEFDGEDRGGLSAGAKDPKWTAEDMYYYPTKDLEVYKPEQVKVTGGSAVVTMELKTSHAMSQQPDGVEWKRWRNLTSGFVTGWNKFCFTGGYLEVNVRLPGNDFYPGLWPAAWMMGNLGRAGYMETTDGFWPYSYSTCRGSNENWWSNLPSQNLSACTDPQGFNRSIWGMDQHVGRGAPEIDLLEVRVNPGNDGSPDNHGPNYQPPTVSQTLQMGPLMPPGQSYDPSGLHYTGSSSQYHTKQNSFTGNDLQNSISAVSDLSSSFYSGFHTFGVDWSPGEYLRWYIDGTQAFEITKEALHEVDFLDTNGTFFGPRLIPVEPMYIIFNLGMGADFSGRIDWEHLQFPAEYYVDYVRVYQSKEDGLNVGCSPPDYPTEQYIACHRKKYITRKSDNVLIPGSCTSAASAPARLHLGALAAGLLLLLAAL